MSGAIASSGVHLNPRHGQKKKIIYIYIYILPLNKKFEHPKSKFCLNLVEISLNKIILGGVWIRMICVLRLRF